MHVWVTRDVLTMGVIYRLDVEMKPSIKARKSRVILEGKDPFFFMEVHKRFCHASEAAAREYAEELRAKEIARLEAKLEHLKQLEFGIE